jgi:hypothetical protein
MGGYAVDDRGVVFDVSGTSFLPTRWAAAPRYPKRRHCNYRRAGFHRLRSRQKKQCLIGAVFGTYAVDDFETIMTSRIFDGGSYSILCDGDGGVLAQTEKEICLTQQTNILRFWTKTRRRADGGKHSYKLQRQQVGWLCMNATAKKNTPHTARSDSTAGILCRSYPKALPRMKS